MDPLDRLDSPEKTYDTGTLPFRQPGRFYRGNLHTHSTRSDGALAPDVVVEEYRRRGYDFIALTDHFLERFGYPITDTRELRSPEFTTLIGAELHAPRTEAGVDWHLVGIAHPAWYSLTLADALSIEAAHAVEVYNEGTAQWNDRGQSWYICDLMLARGRRVNAYIADDAHFISLRPAAFAAWVQVRAPELSPEALLSALRAGWYYSSQGPEIHDIALDSGQITISCSPADGIFVSGPGALARQAHQSPGEPLTSASFSLDGFLGSYCRVTILDSSGKRAWSNPIWLPGEPR